MKKYSVLSLLALLLAGFTFALPSHAASGCCSDSPCCQSGAACCK